MKIKVYLLHITVAVLACVFGVAVCNGLRWFRTQFVPIFSAKTVKAPMSDTEISKIKFQIDEQAKNIPPVIETAPNFETDFNPTGYYLFNDEKLPEGFKDFTVMEIDTGSYDIERDEFNEIAPKGYIQTKAYYDFARISISPKRITFETEKVGGVSYKFTGEFIKNKSGGFNAETNSPDLKGKLVKMKNGKKIAETDAEFFFTIGC